MILLALPALPSSHLFLHWFSDLLFNMGRSSKSSGPGPKTTKKHENQQKNTSSTRTHNEDLSKARSGKCRISEFDIPHNPFNCFPKGPEPSKQSQERNRNGSFWHSKTQENCKKSIPKNSEEQDHETVIRVSILVPN